MICSTCMQPRCAAELAADGLQRMKTVHADVQRKLQPDARVCVSRSMGAALKAVDATLKAVSLEAAADAGLAAAPPGPLAADGGDGGAAAAGASVQQTQLVGELRDIAQDKLWDDQRDVQHGHHAHAAQRGRRRRPQPPSAAFS